MHAELYRLAGEQRGLVARQQAIGLGLTGNAIRGLTRYHGWDRVYPGVLGAPGFEKTWRQSLKALHLWGGGEKGIAVSHRAAAALFGLPGFPEGVLEVTIRRNAEGLGPSVTAHDRPPRRDAIMMLDGIPVMNRLHTFLVLGSVADPALVGTALDAAVDARDVTVQGLRHTLKKHGRHYRGAEVLAGLLAERGYYRLPPNNNMEAAFLALVLAAGLPAPQRQVEIRGARGWIGRVDFVYLEFRLVMELDGFASHGSRDAFQADRERDRKLVADGWRIVRFTWADIQERPQRVVAELRALLAQAGRAGVPS